MRHASPLPLGVGVLLLRASFFDSVVSAIDSLVRERARFLTFQARRDNGTCAADTRDLRGGGERSLGCKGPEGVMVGLVVVGLGDGGRSILAGGGAARAHFVHPSGSLVAA